MTTKNEIFNYVMKTPENTNPAILKSLLDELNEGGGGGGGATVTTFFDDTVTFSPVQTQWGTNYEAEAHVATLPIDFPAYDPDLYYSHVYNTFLNCITPTNGGCKVIGQMLPDEEELLMVLSWIFCPISTPSDENCQVTLYPDGTLKFLAYNEWAQTPTRIQFQLVEIWPR